MGCWNSFEDEDELLLSSLLGLSVFLVDCLFDVDGAVDVRIRPKKSFLIVVVVDIGIRVLRLSLRSDFDAWRDREG